MATSQEKTLFIVFYSAVWIMIGAFVLSLMFKPHNRPVGAVVGFVLGWFLFIGGQYFYY